MGTRGNGTIPSNGFTDVKACTGYTYQTAKGKTGSGNIARRIAVADYYSSFVEQTNQATGISIGNNISGRIAIYYRSASASNNTYKAAYITLYTCYISGSEALFNGPGNNLTYQAANVASIGCMIGHYGRRAFGND